MGVNQTVKSDCSDPDQPKSWKDTWIKYLVAGVLTGIFVAIFLWVADRVGSMWGALIASIPVTLFAAITFVKESRLHTFTFALILGSIAYFVAAVVFLSLISRTSWSRWVVLGAAFVAWAIVIGILFWWFRDSLKDHE
jgi:drug/metabolite transporter (DMT)-like permease